jgi:hypothetical protein
MTIAFIHYHLKPGGVTRVIQQQLGICEAMGWQYCILAGENPLELPNVRIIHELHYDLHRSGLGDPSNGDNPAVMLADQIEAEIRAAMGSADLLHVHNATLAKNSDLLPALHELQKRGNRLFLQLHDFAEDGRPTVYSSSPYPADAHYGYINSRDGANLAAAGVSEDRLHAIPNLISPLPGAIPAESELPGKLFRSGSAGGSDPGRRRRFALYPVRGIRRKNLGETLLLSLLCDDLDIGITLEPNNPADMPSYRFWESLAEEIRAPVQFNVAQDIGFEQALERADFFISTSVQEGFGFTFLEPWTLGKGVVGRAIPYVHRDFVAEGMRMDRFYHSIPVPADLFELSGFRDRWMEEAERRLSRFRIALRNQGLDSAAGQTRVLTEGLDAAFDGLYGSGSIDFGRLDPDNQAMVLRAAAADPQVRGILREGTPELGAPPFAWGAADSGTDSDPGTAWEPAIRENHRRVYDAYGQERYRLRLEKIYRRVLADRDLVDGSDGSLDKEKLLFSFLDPQMIFLVTSLSPEQGGGQ